MQITFSFDPDDNQLLAVYVRINEGKVKKTVNLSDGSCLVDVDAKGRPLGIEMLNPESLRADLRKASKKFGLGDITSAVKAVKDVVTA